MNADNFFNQGLDKHLQGDYQGAIASYTQAIKLNHEYAEAYHNRGIIKSGEFKDYHAAIADFDRAIEINPDFAQAYYNRANARYFLADYTGAIAESSSGITNQA